jgi:hypothetical protein
MRGQRVLLHWGSPAWWQDATSVICEALENVLYGTFQGTVQVLFREVNTVVAHWEAWIAFPVQGRSLSRNSAPGTARLRRCGRTSWPYRGIVQSLVRLGGGGALSQRKFQWYLNMIGVVTARVFAVKAALDRGRQLSGLPHGLHTRLPDISLCASGLEERRFRGC